METAKKKNTVKESDNISIENVNHAKYKKKTRSACLKSIF